MVSDTSSNDFILWSSRRGVKEDSCSSDMDSSAYIGTPSDTREQWNKFVNEFKTRRFFVSEEDTLLKHHIRQIINDNVHPINVGAIYFRARINDDGKDFSNDEELDAPPEHLVGIGRLNQRGVRNLYVADHPKTGISELRPWRNAKVTVAEARALETINVIDFVPKNTDSQDSFKRIIGELFSRPVRPNISDIEYLPTQCIAEFVKKNGYGGVRYASAVNPGGINYCLFDPKCMDIKISHKVVVTTIDVDSEKVL